MPFTVTTDCICPLCGGRHKAEIDLDMRPPGWANYYEITCAKCRAIPLMERQRVMKERCRQINRKAIGRHRVNPPKQKRSTAAAGGGTNADPSKHKCERPYCSRLCPVKFKLCYLCWRADNADSR